MNLARSSKSTATRQTSEEAPTNQAPEKVLNFAMFLKSSEENAIYHTVKGEKRYGLLIDPGAASGLIGSETLRNIMEHCIPSDKIEDHVTWNQKTTSVAGISGESDETLGEVNLKLNATC
eukprot:s2643_g2.t1